MDIVFPIMPFSEAGRPSMGVSLLAAEVQAAGFSTKIIYFNLDFAGTMGLVAYQQVASGYPPNMLIGEWMFADDLFGSDIADPDEYINDIFIPQAGNNQELIAAMLKAREERAEFLQQCVDEIMTHSPRIVGFSTVFHQTCACLAVARRLKALHKPPRIVFGGANCEDEMGLQMIRSFPWIDFICSGESDIIFPKLMERLCGDMPNTPIPGVLERDRMDAVERSVAVTDMDALPFPDFDDYFARLDNSLLAGQFKGNLVFETSRGCWWGAKHHCTFCGLNGDTMVFRSKSPDRAFEEIAYLTRRHGAKQIGCVDNILDMKYLTTLFPRLAEAGLDLDMFYEVKSNLRYKQLVQMRAGGVKQIQPGIESFSDMVLKLMDKGCTGFQNIQLLRWCKEIGIEASWNMIAGFPNEDPAEYEMMAQLIPRLIHLDPPCSCGILRLDRFSPFHSRPEEYGFKRLRPARAYFYVFPFGRRKLNNLAYFFDFDYEDGRVVTDYILPVQRETQAWLAASNGTDDNPPPRLDAEFSEQQVSIIDTRPAATAPKRIFTGLAARVYARCDTPTPVAKLVREFGVSTERIEAILEEFNLHHLIARNENRVISLAVFRVRSNLYNNNFKTHQYAQLPKTAIA